MGGQTGGAPGDGDPVAIAVGGREHVHRRCAGVGQLVEDGVLAGQVGLEVDQPPDGAVVLRQQGLGGRSRVVELGIPVNGAGDGHEVAAVLHPGDDIVALAQQAVDLRHHIGQRGGGGEEGLVDEIEPGGGGGGDAPEGEQGILIPVRAVADVALGVQPVPQGAGVKGGGIIRPRVTHEDGDGGHQTAGAGHVVDISQGGLAPGRVGLPPGGIVGAVGLALIGGGPGGTGQGDRQQAQCQGRRQGSGDQAGLFHKNIPPFAGDGRGYSLVSHKFDQMSS